MTARLAVSSGPRSAWWNGHPLDRIRTSHLARLELTELTLAA
ncbi:hypothetical protein [Microtetraspora sp. NBRC 13810]|nr:hypothetical protein [Microtetraspora sp. NBRC 13810]